MKYKDSREFFYIINKIKDIELDFTIKGFRGDRISKVRDD